MPKYGIPEDQLAIQVFQEAMPGYEVIGFDDLNISSNDLIGRIATDAILTKISDGSIDQAKLGTLTVANANITGQLDFAKLSISSANIISTIADEAIANAKQQR